MFTELAAIYLHKKPFVFMCSTCPSREVDHFLGWTASRSGTVTLPVLSLHGIPALKRVWGSERQRAYPGIRFEGGAPDHCGGGGRGRLEQRRESQKTLEGGVTSSESRRGHQDISWCRKLAENRGGSAKNTRRIPWSSKYRVVHGIRSLGQNLAPPAKIFVSHEVLRSKILHGIHSVSRWDTRSRLQFAYE